VDETCVRRLIEVEGSQVVVKVSENDDYLEATVLNSAIVDEDLITQYVIDWFDLDRDINPFYELLSNTSFKYMTEMFSGLRMVGIPDLFESLCWCIIGQQINLTFAHTLKRRLVEKWGESMELNGEIYHSFPTPKALVRLTMADLKEIHFSRQKAQYVLELAKKFANGEVAKEKMASLSDEEKYRMLIDLKGVGEWTANYAMMKTFRNPAGIPFGDIGIYQALENHNLLASRKDCKAVEMVFSQFPEWGGYLTIYLWRSLTANRK